MACGFTPFCSAVFGWSDLALCSLLSFHNHTYHTHTGKLGLDENSMAMVMSPLYSVPFFRTLGRKDTIKDVVATETHSLVLTEQGYVYCVGDNSEGQCGNGRTSNEERYAVRMKLPNDEPVASIAAGKYYSIVKGKSGTVYSTGNAGYGCLGLGESIKSVHSPTAINVTGTPLEGKSIVQISGGSTHVLLLTEDGIVFGHGDNSGKAPGCGCDEEVIWIPSRIKFDPIDGEIIVEISAGTDSSLILSDKGRLYMFGKRGANLDDSDTPQLVDITQVIQNRHIVSIAAGDGFGVILMNDGTVASFGNGDGGQLGAGKHVLCSEMAVEVDMRRYETKKAVSISTGVAHTLVVLDDGNVVCFGRNLAAVCGTGDLLDKYVPETTVLDGSQYGTFISAFSGGYQSYAYIARGNLYVFGDNENGQLGDGTLRNRYEPRVLLDNAVHNFLGVVVGTDHLLAYTASGELWSAGINTYGQLGDGSTATRYRPILIDSLPGRVKRIGAGNYYSLVLTENNEVYSFGGNHYGSTGHPKSSDLILTVPTLVNFRNWTVVDIEAGLEHAAALVTSSTGSRSLMTWGRNTHGKLCQNMSGSEKDNVFEPHPVFITEDMKNKEILQFVLGKDHTLVLLDDGNIFGCGSNQWLVLGEHRSSTNSFVMIDVSGVLNNGQQRFIVEIASNHNHNLMLLTDGTVMGWGHNIFGQISGNSPNSSIGTPLEILSLAPYMENHSIRIYAGRYISAVVVVPTCNGIGSDQSADVCGGHGLCIGPEKCVCEKGYREVDFCKSWNCFGVEKSEPNVCSGHGPCVSPNRCECLPGYQGVECEIPVCNTLPASNERVCSGNGVCIDRDRCICVQGWNGPNCEIHIKCGGIPSTNETVCSGNGNCSSVNVCECVSGWSGHFCETAICPNECNHNGKCVKPGECECNWGYVGKDCSFYLLAIMASVFAVLIILVFFIVIVALIMALVIVVRNVRVMVSRTQYDNDLRDPFLIAEISELEDIPANFLIDAQDLEISKEVLGQGSQGVVLRGRYMGTDVAVKFYQKSAYGIENDLTDFFRESRLLMRHSNHQNVIRFIGVCDLTNKLALVTELCVNGNLASFIEKNRGKVSWFTKLKILHGIASAMKYLQASGIVHRDLKPENCLLDEMLTVKIADFALSRFVRQATTQTDNMTLMVGTAAYAAPEVIRYRITQEDEIHSSEDEEDLTMDEDFDHDENSAHSMSLVGSVGLHSHTMRYRRSSLASNKTNSANLKENQITEDWIGDATFYDAKCDVYSLGIIMWVMYFESIYPYGRNITDVRIVANVCWRKDWRPKISRRTIIPQDHQWYIALMKRCWQFDPNARPSFHEILEELEQHLTTQDV